MTCVSFCPSKPSQALTAAVAGVESLTAALQHLRSEDMRDVFQRILEAEMMQAVQAIVLWTKP